MFSKCVLLPNGILKFTFIIFMIFYLKMLDAKSCVATNNTNLVTHVRKYCVSPMSPSVL